MRIYSELEDYEIISSDRLYCREIAYLDAAYAEANLPLDYEQQLCPIDVHFILTLMYTYSDEQENMLRLMSLDYEQSSASTLHAPAITCDKGCKNRFSLSEMYVRILG